MKFVKIEDDKNLDEIIELYKNIKASTYTVWEEDYPDKELILEDIKKGSFYALVNDDNELVSIAYAGKRYVGQDINYPWEENIKNIATYARFGVNPKFQHMGYGKLMITNILQELKKRNFDGVRILVEVANVNAIKLYDKFGFNNCGKVTKYGNDYYCYELLI